MLSDLMNGTAYTHCVEIGDGKLASVFMSMPAQVAAACAAIQRDPVLAGTPVHVVGISQGGLIARALVEACTNVTVRKLMTFGSPHTGVSAIHNCAWNVPCLLADRAARALVYLDWVQALLAPAEYFRVFYEAVQYLHSSYFLPFVNNEAPEKRELYRERLQALEHFRMFKWREDHVVYPSESEWFGMLDEQGRLLTMEDTQLYQQDWIGLRNLTEANRTSRIEIPGDHMNIEAWML